MSVNGRTLQETHTSVSSGGDRFRIETVKIIGFDWYSRTDLSNYRQHRDSVWIWTIRLLKRFEMRRFGYVGCSGTRMMRLSQISNSNSSHHLILISRACRKIRFWWNIIRDVAAAWAAHLKFNEVSDLTCFLRLPSRLALRTPNCPEFINIAPAKICPNLK